MLAASILDNTTRIEMMKRDAVSTPADGIRAELRTFTVRDPSPAITNPAQ